MDIGNKIKNARTTVGLTQEQTAESLGVSRQTISNWENGKTYPDIVSVVRMSELYDISLDHLLKEEEPMSDYLDYLEESTNTVKSRRRLGGVILAVVYLVIWAAAIIAFWFLGSGSDAMGYSLVYLWILLPVTTFVVSLLIGKNDYMGEWKWLSFIAFGIMYMLSEYATFGAANMAAFDKVNIPVLGMVPAGAMISLIGMGIGMIIRKSRKKDS